MKGMARQGMSETLGKGMQQEAATAEERYSCAAEKVFGR